jgi:hypothetical protein
LFSQKEKKTVMNGPALPLRQLMPSQYLSNSLSPSIMPLAHVGRASPSALLQDPAFGFSYNVASLLQCEREMFLQQAFIENLATKRLQMLCDSPKSAGIAKKRVTKALSGGTRTYKKENMARRQIKLVVNGKMGPLPPPPTLLSLKQWQILKLQLNPNKPQYCSSFRRIAGGFQRIDSILEKESTPPSL